MACSKLEALLVRPFLQMLNIHRWLRVDIGRSETSGRGAWIYNAG